MQFADLIDEHGAWAFERQERLGTLVGGSSWRLDLDRGELIFDRFSVPVQILGTASEITQTWLWAWANVESNLPAELVVAANRIRELGRELEVAELTEAEFEVTDYAKGHHIALVSVGLLDGAAYYRAPYEGGAVFLLLPELPDRAADDRPPNLAIASTFTKFVSAVECDHRIAFEAYVRRKGYVSSASGRTVTAVREGQAPLEAVFDGQGRLVRLDAQISQPRSKRPWWKFLTGKFGGA